MKKLMPFIAGALFALFVAVVFVTVLSLSFRALGMIFPDDLFDQAIGLALFDAAAVVWFLVFVYKSKSIWQYVAAVFGFLAGLFGMVGLVGIEVGISSGMLEVEAMMKPLTYIFIAAAVAHVVLIYAREASAPEVAGDISLGVEKAKVTAEGMRQAEQVMQKGLPQLGAHISADLVRQALRDLGIGGQVIDLPALPVDDSLFVGEQKDAGNFFERMTRGLKNLRPQARKEVVVPQEKLSPQDPEGVVWRQLENGKRERLFCLKCRAAGLEWATREPCEHVLQAKGEPIDLQSDGSVQNVADLTTALSDHATAEMHAKPEPIDAEKNGLNVTAKS